MYLNEIISIFKQKRWSKFLFWDEVIFLLEQSLRHVFLITRIYELELKSARVNKLTNKRKHIYKRIEHIF
jgi:hypothetical protein